MPIYKVTYFFKTGVQGWTESMYLDATTPAVAVVKANVLGRLRIALCGDNVDMPHIRISDIAVRGDSVQGGLPGYTTRTNSPNLTQVKSYPADQKSDLSWTALLVSLAKDQVTRSRIYMRGIADIFFESDRVFVPDEDWKKAFDRWGSVVADASSGWGVRRKPMSTPANTYRVLSGLATANTLVKLVVDNGFAAAQGNQVAIRGMKTVTGQTFSIDVPVVSFVAPLLTVLYQFPTDVVFVPTKGTVQVATKTFITELSASYGLPTTRHSGRPFGVLPGRRKRQLLLR